MPLFSKPGSRYLWCRFQVNGKRYKRSTGETTRRAAAAKERELRAYYERTTTTRRRGAVTLSTLAGMDYDRAAAQGATDARLKAIDYAWERITDFFGNAEVGVITYDNVERYLQHRVLSDGVAGQTARRERQALQRMAQAAHVRGWLPVLPAVWPRLRDKAKKASQAGKLHPPAVLELWFDRLQGEAYIEARLALLCGLRKAELHRMTIDWIEEHDERLYLHVPQTGSKTRAERWVGLTDEAVELIESLPGGRLTGATHQTARETACRNIGHQPYITLRDLRHTYLTVGLQRTGDAQAAQAAAGHSDLRTTQRYQHTTLARNAAVSDAVASEFRRRSGPSKVAPRSGSAKFGGRRRVRTADLLLVRPNAETIGHLLACDHCAQAVHEVMEMHLRHTKVAPESGTPQQETA